MPPNMYADIIDFHRQFRLGYEGKPRTLPEDLFQFRLKFLKEELEEYDIAHGEGNKAKQLDALVDLVYVALGTADLHGFDFDEAWRRVHEANMKKVRALRASDSARGSIYDVIKPTGWVPPDHTDLVE